MIGQVQIRERDRVILLEAFRRFPWVREVWVYGSRARGQARMNSDIDLAVEAEGASDVEWGRLTSTLDELPIILRIDCLRLDETVPAKLREQMDRDRLLLFEFPISGGRADFRTLVSAEAEARSTGTR
jgi:predicted nucleotidyltransferase